MDPEFIETAMEKSYYGKKEFRSFGLTRNFDRSSLISTFLLPL